MHRKSLGYLQNWLKSVDRKPLVIRGARQVGKTWLVRHFSQQNGKKLIEINFEKHPSRASLFASNDPKTILLNLSILFNEEIDSKNCLLFLDEIQTVPEIFSKLRWFAEDMPELPVIAAGSLLEFLLAEHSFSMPVGRISYLHVEPLSFEEFLLAKEKKNYQDFLLNYDLSQEIPLAIHENLINLFKEYLVIGGMPAVVATWIKEESLIQVNKIQHDLLATYRDDFAKYRGRITIQKLDEVMMAVPKMLGEKFKFSRVNPSIQASSMKQILDLLAKARICHPVISCSANGIPLASECNEKYFKEIFLDAGLCCAALGLNFNQFNSAHEILFINNGGMAEQVVGQLLRTIDPPYIEPALYYWLRGESGSNAEIDYVIQHGNKVIPIEVKAGSTGGLKSLHLFMGRKKLSLAVRINSDFPTKAIINVKDHDKNKVEYTLISIPFYLVGQLHRLLNSA